MKTLITEPESPVLIRYLSQQPLRRVSSALLRTEALRAVRHLGPSAVARVRLALGRVDLVSVDDAILEAAGMLDPTVMRTLDAIHLATALALADDLKVLVTYDRRMMEGARLLGLRTVVPA